jgi:hypothetical protein
MFTLLRRFLALAALFFWQGGFTFYASVVVPVGQDVLHGHLEQGFVTRRVTVFLNLSGLVALPVLTWELWAAPDPASWRRRLRWLLWLALGLTLVALYLLHARLDALLDPDDLDISDRKTFGPLHRLYLWTSTLQWACGIGYLLLTLASWRAEDRTGGNNRPTRAGWHTDEDRTPGNNAWPGGRPGTGVRVGELEIRQEGG